MQYIPQSRIKREEVITIVKKLNLPEDVINHHILSYVDEFLDLSDGIEHFWINLGIESCNLRKMSWCSYFILQHSFGKTKYKFVHKWAKLFEEILSLLDDLVCCYYPPYHSIGSDEIPLTHIFYRLSNIKEYRPTPDPSEGSRSWKYSKTITSQDKQYILKWIERMNVYLNYLKGKLDTLVGLLSRRHRYRAEMLAAKKKIIKIINKMKKIYEGGGEVINDISVRK